MIRVSLLWDQEVFIWLVERVRLYGIYRAVHGSFQEMSLANGYTGMKR
jgi:hypothetical protein